MRLTTVSLTSATWHADAHKEACSHRAMLKQMHSMPQEFKQSFERGLPISDMQQQPQSAGDGKASGTTVRFLYDKSIFTPGWALRLCRQALNALRLSVE